MQWKEAEDVQTSSGQSCYQSQRYLYPAERATVPLDKGNAGSGNEIEFEDGENGLCIFK